MSLAKELKRLKRKKEKAAFKRLRRKSILEALEPRLLLDGTGFDPDPVIVIPGFAGTLPADTSDAGLDEWFTTRGIAAEKLQIDPIGNTFTDLIKTLENVGYEEGSNLFVATWDWRVPVAPIDGTTDGTVSGVTAGSITDAIYETGYETGLDYLGYWLEQAASTGAQSVDIIAHSAGGLIARSYIQSDAYGGEYQPGLLLPVVDDLVMVGVPNEGAVEIWNVMGNDFDGSTETGALAVLIDHAWDLVQEGQTIVGPDYDITDASDPAAFISQYLAAANDLLPTFDFLDSNGDSILEPLPAAYQNNFLIDLNTGFDPGAFLDLISGELTTVYSANEDTLTAVCERTGPLGDGTIQNFNEPMGHIPASDEIWYEEINTANSGDGTVTRNSATGLFEPSSEAHFVEISGIDHRGLVNDFNAQKAILEALGVTDYVDSDISTGSQNDIGSALMYVLVNPEDNLEGGLTDLMDAFQDGFNDIFDKLPIIGTSFTEAAQFFTDFSDELTDFVDDLVNQAAGDFIQSLQNTLFDVFDPYVRENNDDAVINPEDIVIGVADNTLLFDVHLGGQILGTSMDIDFDVGLDALGLDLSLQGGLDFTIDWDIEFGFGVNLTDKFFLNTEDPNEAQLSISTTLQEATELIGSLGFLRLVARDMFDEDDVDEVLGSTGHTGIFGSVGVDLRDPNHNDGRLTWEEIKDYETDLREVVVGMVNAGADVNLETTIDFGTDNFPSISTDFDLDWDFFDASTAEEAQHFGDTPEIAFNNVTLDLGGFISEVIGPVLDNIQMVTEPIQPIIDILTMDIPVISDLAGPTTLLDLAKIFGGDKFNPAYIDAVETVIGLVDMFNDLDTSQNIRIGFGDFPLTGVDFRDDNASLSDAETTFSDFDLGANLNEQGASGSTKNFIASLDGGGLLFPLLTDPMTMFEFITGATVDIFRYEMPNLQIEFAYGHSFYIFPGLMARLEGNVGAIIDLDFGFDTYGIEQFAAGGFDDPDLIFEGFYIDDHANGTDGAELSLYAGIQGKAALNAVVLEAGVGGGVFADVFFDLNDLGPVPDGKLRPGEFAALVDMNPIYLFNVDGAVRAGLYAYIWVGLDLGWLGTITFYEDRFDIFNETLVDFHFEPLSQDTQLAHLQDGALHLHMGDAGLFEDEIFEVTQTTRQEEGEDTDYLVVSAYGISQEFLAGDVDRIYADAGSGDDAIVVGEGVTALVELYGGEGDDTLQTQSSGPVSLFGGGGNDTLTVVGAGSALLTGGSGDDELLGEDITDLVEFYGEEGNDTLRFNGQVPSQLFGGAGDDLLMGGHSHDKLYGGQGADRLNGREGNDILKGGSGDDQYFWDAGGGADSFEEFSETGVADQVTIGGSKTPVSTGTRVSRYVEDDDAVTVSKFQDGADWKVLIDTTAGAVTIDNIESISVAPGGGADIVKLDDLSGTDVTDLGVDLGYRDQGESDSVVFLGSDGDDTITVDGALKVVGREVQTDENGYLVGFGEDVYEPVARITDTTAGSQRSAYIMGSNPGSDHLTIVGDEGGDALSVLFGSDGVRIQDLIDVTLAGGSGDDTLTTVYGNVEVLGGAGDNDRLVLLDDPDSPGRADIRLVEDHMAVYRAGTLEHLVTYAGIESLELGLGPDAEGNDLTVLNTIPGTVSIDGSDGNDTVTIRGISGPVSFSGNGGEADALVIDREADTNGLEGTIMADTLAGFGFISPISYSNVERVDLHLGSGVDAVMIEGTSALTTVNVGGGGDQIRVSNIGEKTTINGDSGEDTLSLVVVDPPFSFADLTFAVETLALAHVGDQAIDWRVEDGMIRAGSTDVVDIAGAGRIVIAGNGKGDTLTVADHVPDQQTVTIHGDTVQIRHGATVLSFEGSLSDPPLALSPVFGPTGEYLYAIGGTGLDDKMIETYGRDTGSGGLSLQAELQRLWIEQAKLIASDGASGDWLGDAVAMDGDTVVVGAPGDNLYGLSNVGSAYVYQWKPDQNGVWTWQQSAKLTAPDGTGRPVSEDPSGLYGDSFGDDAVAISGDTIFVGAEGDDYSRGSVYIFTRDANGDGIEDWGFVKKIYAYDRAASDHFGCSMEISDDTLVVGAFGDDSFAGSAYIFTRDANGDGIEDWGFVKKIYAYDREASDLFGGNVAISGDTLMVGLWADNNHTGSVYIFRRDANGDGVVDWGFVNKLTPPAGSDLDSFGSGIAIDGDTAVIGAPDYYYGYDPGAAYVYREQTPGKWHLEATLTAAEDDSFNWFGHETAIQDNVIFVSSYEMIDEKWDEAGIVRIFQEDGAGQWVEVGKLTGDPHDMFGYCFGLSGDRVVIGAPGDSDNGSSSGSASVFLNADIVAGAATMVLSPDGAHLYVARPDRDTLSMFDRDATTGALTFIEEMTDPVHLEGVDLVRINPAGTLAYAATDDGLSIFSRDTVSGNLNFLEAIDTGPLGRVTGLALSPDGLFVYVTGEGNLLRTLHSSGTTLIQEGEDLPVSNPGMLALSPGGENLYATRTVENAVSIFSRDATTGQLTLLQEIRNGAGGVRGLSGVSALAVTDDYVFATGETDDSLVVFRREEDGKLIFSQRLRNRSGGIVGMENPNGVAVSSDGEWLYVTGSIEGASLGGVAWFHIDAGVSMAPPLTIMHSGVDALTVTTAGADDLVSAKDVTVPLTLGTGGGADNVSLLGSQTGSATEVTLGDGDDFLEIRGTGEMTSNSIFAEGGEDTIQVWRTDVNATTTIDAGSDADLIHVAGMGLDADLTIKGDDPISVPGDTMYFDSAGGLTQQTSAVPGDGTIQVVGSGVVSYESIETLEVFAPATPDAGGPYLPDEGDGISLDATASVAPTGRTIISYLWDIDGDGLFGDVMGSTSNLTWNDLVAMGLGDGDPSGTAYPIALQVTNDLAQESVAFSTIIVTNTEPVLGLTGDPLANENTPYALDLLSQDPGQDSISSWTVDWGDGSVQTINGNPGFITHTYDYREEPYEITARATDEDGTYGPVTHSVAVNDVPPVQYLLGDESVDEGAEYLLQAIAAGTGNDAFGQWVIDWGDGSPKEMYDTPAVMLTHVFADDSAHEPGGIFEIKATAVDEDGIYSTTKAVTVGNVSPVLTLTGDETVDEGQRCTVEFWSEDPGHDTIVSWTLDWGDGKTETVPGETETLSHIYAEGEREHGIILTATDEDGTHGPATLTVTVYDVAPTVEISGESAVKEGAFYTLTIEPAVDPGEDTVTAYVIDWGDGTEETASPPALLDKGFMPSSSLSHVYEDEGDVFAPITVTLIDEDGTYTDAAILDRTVNNVAPAPHADSDRTVNEGDPVVLNGSFFDPGLKDSHTLLWQVSADNNQVVPDGTGESLIFTPVDDGLYTATFTVTDNDGGVGVDSVVITVKNVVPSIELAGEDTAIEAEPYALTLGPVNDPGDDTVTDYIVHWGDGETNTYSTPGAVTHAYMLPGVTQTVAVDLVDEDGTHAGVAKKEILVVSAAPEIIDLEIDPSVIDENDMVTLTGEFDQLGLAVAHTVTVDWGDNNTSTLVIDPPAQPGAESFVFEHRYLDDDPAGTPWDEYTIHVTVADNDGDTDSGTVSLTVLNVAPIVSEVSATDVLENGVITLIGTISDPGTLDTFTLDVNWGDPLSPDNIQQFAFAAGTTSFNLTHQYLDDNPTATGFDAYNIDLLLTDDDGGSDTESASVTVNNVAPTVDAGADQGVKEGDEVFFGGAFTDPSTLDTHTIQWDFGDGTAPVSGTLTPSHVYADEGDYTASLTVTDDDGGTTTDSLSVSVENVAPTVTATESAVTVDEGDTAINSGAFSDPGLVDDVTIIASVGRITQETGNSGTWSWSFGTTDGPAESQTVTITATDNDGGSTSTTFGLTVLNVAPSVDAGPDTAVNEGDTLLRKGTFSDPGADSWTATVDYGDDSSVQALTLNNDNTFDLSHVYADDGNYTVTVTVTDDDGGMTESFFDVVVNNVAPTVVAGEDQMVNEGVTVSLVSSTFNDPGTLDTHTATIDWGDGTVLDIGAVTEAPFGPPGSTAGADGTISGSHVYADDGTYTVTVSVTDDDGAATSDTFQVTVENAAPVMTGCSLNHDVIVENGVVTLSGSFTDAGPVDTHDLEVNWGDGATSCAVIDADIRTFTASHRYLDDDPTGTVSDNYDIKLTLTDDDDGSAIGTLSLTVNNAAPLITGLFNSAPNVGDAGEGEFISITGAITDVGTLDTHEAEINWGDNTVSQATLAQGSGFGSFGGIHAYEFGGIYEILVTLTDDDGGLASQSTTALITGAGINNGVLQIVGTVGRDDVHVKAKGKHHETFEVKAGFIPDRGHKRIFQPDDINSIEILLGEGKDKARIDHKIDLPVFMDGGPGNDDLKAGSGDAELYGGSGNDKLYGGHGNDLLDGGSGDDRLYGDGGYDLLLGGEGDDRIYGGHGDDHLDGGAGNDSLYGGSGQDELLGGEGDDRLYGDNGDDVLSGGAGDDRLYGGHGDDVLNGDEGNDRLYGGNGDDVLNGGAGIDLLIGGHGDDELLGGAGDDWIFGNSGNDTLDGGDGNDKLIGDHGDDVIIAGLGNDWACGGKGDDTLDGGEGDDILIGDQGDDILYGGDGNDLLIGGHGNDVLNGGEGDDSLYDGAHKGKKGGHGHGHLFHGVMDSCGQWVKDFVLDQGKEDGSHGPNSGIAITLPDHDAKEDKTGKKGHH